MLRGNESAHGLFLLRVKAIAASGVAVEESSKEAESAM